jgi:hypothetical protein
VDLNITNTTGDVENDTKTTAALSGGQTETVTFEDVTGGLDTGAYDVDVNVGQKDSLEGELYVTEANFNLDFEEDSPYNNGSDVSVTNESGIEITEDGYGSPSDFEMSLNFSEAGNDTDVKDEVFEYLYVKTPFAGATAVVEDGKSQARFDKAFNGVSLSQMRDGLEVELVGAIATDADSGTYNVTFGIGASVYEEQEIEIDPAEDRGAEFNWNFSGITAGENFTVTNDSAVKLTDPDRVVDEVDILLNVSKNGTDAKKEEVFESLYVNPRFVGATTIVEGGSKQANFTKGFNGLSVGNFRDGLEAELIGEFNDTGKYNLTFTMVVDGKEFEEDPVGVSSFAGATQERDGVVYGEDEFTVTVTNQAGSIEPLIDEFEDAPQNIEESEGGLDDSLMEDLDGDGVTDVSETVKVFGELIRGEDLGVSDEQARMLNWNEDSPETEVTVADMVALFGEQIRAD